MEREPVDMPYRQLQCSPSYSAVINEGTDDHLEVNGYDYKPLKVILFWLLTLLTLGFIRLVVRWKPEFGVVLTCQPCPLSRATIVIFKDKHNRTSVQEVCIEPVRGTLPAELQFTPTEDVQRSEDTIRLTRQSHSPACIRYVIHHCIKYIWNSREGKFKQLRGLDDGRICSDFHDFFGWSSEEQEEKQQIYGKNVIDIEVKSYWRLLVDEVLNPFYIFQGASILLWSLDSYYYYAACIFIISWGSIAVSLYDIKKQMITLRNMVAKSNELIVTVHRSSGVLEDIQASRLVPGDVIAIPPSGCTMSCDAVLISGNCIVNESMLTGESVPETKTPLTRQDDTDIYSVQNHKRHTLFCGTEVLQTRYYGNHKVLAIVIRTGFLTAKGELIRSILFPKPLGFKFYKDAMHFVFFLFCLSLIGMGMTIYLYVREKNAVTTVLLRTFDIITIVVPPALPAAMTVGIVYAQSRLKRQGIFCISPPRINISGKLKLICFDKTGTLTEEGMDLWGVVPVENRKFIQAVTDVDTLPEHGKVKTAMAACHSLTIIDSKLSGDPLDLKMFLSTKWMLEEPGSDNAKYDLLVPTVVKPPDKNLRQNDLVDATVLPKIATLPEYDAGVSSKQEPASTVMEPADHTVTHSTEDITIASSSIDQDLELPLEVGIIRQFPFSSTLQRMSVICRVLGSDHMELYAKGSPEKISSLCSHETVPENFNEVLHGYTLHGYRVIAVAWKPLECKLTWHHSQRLKRDQVECNLTFLGLLVMQNTLKPETSPVISKLHAANIRSVMVTGDNILTALSVARECGMIPQTDPVILAHATLSEGTDQAQIRWEHAEATSADTTDYPTAADHRVIIEPSKSFHFAVDGKSFGVIRAYCPELLPKLLVRGTVFARMAPDQKAQLVEELQNLGYVVSMCGDGANDCGALKAADVGISLSEAEASVAAPFTSKIPNIQCVPIVIREGRCALVTSFSMFKFIATYSLIQFVSVIVLYANETNLGDLMFLYIDLPVITSLAVFMGYTEAYPHLVSERPPGSLMKATNLVSLILQLLLVISTQLAVLIYLRLQPWFRPAYFFVNSDNYTCWETTVIFLVSCYQYLTVGLVYAKGPPYRKSFFTNGYFMVSFVAMTALTTLLFFNPFHPLGVFFQLMNWPLAAHFQFRLTLILIVGINFVMSIAIEVCIVESWWLKYIIMQLRKNKISKNKYKAIEKEIQGDSHWFSAVMSHAMPTVH